MTKLTDDERAVLAVLPKMKRCRSCGITSLKGRPLSVGAIAPLLNISEARVRKSLRSLRKASRVYKGGRGWSR